MNKSIFVVTNPELGWDCVCGAYKASSEKVVLEELAKETGRTIEQLEDSFVIHEVSIEELE